jgi:hypothetical protein
VVKKAKKEVEGGERWEEGRGGSGCECEGWCDVCRVCSRVMQDASSHSVLTDDGDDFADVANDAAVGGRYQTEMMRVHGRKRRGRRKYEEESDEWMSG